MEAGQSIQHDLYTAIPPRPLSEATGKFGLYSTSIFEETYPSLGPCWWNLHLRFERWRLKVTSQLFPKAPAKGFPNHHHHHHFLSIRSSSDDGVDPLIRLGPEGPASKSSCNKCGPAFSQVSLARTSGTSKLKTRCQIGGGMDTGGLSQFSAIKWLAGAPSRWVSLWMKLTAHSRPRGWKPLTRPGGPPTWELMSRGQLLLLMLLVTSRWQSPG